MPAKSEEVLEAREPPRDYPDLYDHVDALRDAGLLVEIDQEINKDTEMHPLVRWQFRGGIEETDRKAFLFTNVTDAKGRKYDMPVLVCGLAGSRTIYALGMGCPLEEIGNKWIDAIAHPIEPRVVDSPPCQEIVYQGKELQNGYGLDALPIPISTPGFDNAPYTTSSHFITKDPDTGIQNLGNYRGQVKAPDRIGMNPAVESVPAAAIISTSGRRGANRCPAPSPSVDRQRCPMRRSRRYPRRWTSLRWRALWSARRSTSRVRRQWISLSRRKRRSCSKATSTPSISNRNRRSVKHTAYLPAGVQRLHGIDRDHAQKAPHSQLVAQPDGAERIERHQARVL